MIKCIFIILLLLLLFAIWGEGVSRLLSIATPHLPLQILIGFFSVFIVMEVVILPVEFLHNELRFAAILIVGVVCLITAWMLYRDHMAFLKNVKQIRVTPLLVVAVMVLGGITCVAMLYQFNSYDTAYYIGEMSAFLYHGEFWTRNAFAGLIQDNGIPLHKALSCFYPFFSVLAYLFHVEARLIAMYTARGLCVLLFGCTAYSWGYELFCRDKKRALIFMVVCLSMMLFLLDDHSFARMMMMRGYESKGYCAAIVTPMCVLALLLLCREASTANWHLLGLVSWASMPIAMSSMAVIPVAVVIVAIALMICEKKIWGVCKRAVICILPNMILMGWYVIAPYLL